MHPDINKALLEAAQGVDGLLLWHLLARAGSSQIGKAVAMLQWPILEGCPIEGQAWQTETQCMH